MRAQALGAKLETLPGRTCPVSYRYSPRVFDRAPDIVSDTLYVIGGLYGNIEALEAVKALAARERDPVRLVFNGDFHWFDVAGDDFERITREVLAHAALRGNVETEIAGEASGAGCGCAYPADVSDAEVSRSNEILERLRATARRFPDLRACLAALPMHLTARVGAARVGIVHGDAASLAGWGFAHDRLDEPGHRRWIEAMFREARIDIFASSHTCLPALREFRASDGSGVVANNGAAGMPNFAASQFGLLTRIAVEPFPGPEKLHGLVAAGAHVEALRLDYDAQRWRERFLASWPEGSPAHESYFRRIAQGTRFTLAQALPRRG
ncbi:MAG: metallophosphoesterase family protein [Usitatibacter sp.]